VVAGATAVAEDPADFPPPDPHPAATTITATARRIAMGNRITPMIATVC
jgi:hypothetical protein